jgi:hypothetical protein
MTMNAKTIALMTGLVFCAAALAGAAHAQTCAAHGVVMERLADGYGESRQSIGIGADNTVVEVYASLETGTWTITVTRPGGPTCLVASGYGFEHLAEVLAVDEQGA